VHHDVPAPSAEVPGLPWQVDQLVARTTRRDPGGRPLDAGAFLAELNQVRKDLGVEQVPVPTGVSTAGPGTLRPTNRPTRPRHPSDPGTRVLGNGHGDRGSRTSVLPAAGTGATANVNGRRPPVERPRPGVPQHIRRRRARLAVAIVLLLAVTIGAVGWWLGSGRWTTVPKLAGKEQGAAIDLLQEAGLDPDCCLQEFSENVPEGVVISAKPASGEAIRGTNVKLTVSKGPERFVVPPELTGKPKDDVVAKLQNDLPELSITTRDQYDDKVKAGLVIGFEPAAGEPLKRGQVVTVVVSQGHEPVAVPNVVGQSPDAATQTLEALGFVVQRAPDGRTAAVAKGLVMGVSPAPNAGPQAYGSTVLVQVSAGLPQVKVPDVRGKKAREAVKILQQAGFKVEKDTWVGGDRVAGQTPNPGSTVDQGSTVKILLSFF
jgi:serine/threonine-protein kinase